MRFGPASRRRTYTKIRPYRAGVFNFFDVVYRKDEEATYKEFMNKPGSDEFYASYLSWRTHQMSDHLPMWVELHIDFTDEYLGSIAESIDDLLDD